jgi:hypothetical protein
MPAGINKGAAKFNGRALGLPIEHIVKVLPSSMLNLLALHQELVCSMLDAFHLVNIPRLPLLNLALLGKPLSVAHQFGLQWCTSGAPRISGHWYLLLVAHTHVRHG